MRPVACALDETVTTRQARSAQPVEEQVGKQEWRKVVEGERALEPVYGDVPGVPVAADVVDQHIDAAKGSAAAPRPAVAPPTGRTGPRRTRPPDRLRRDLVGRVPVRTRSLPVIARLLPHPGEARAVARPMPLVAPVIKTVLPVIGPLKICSMFGKDQAGALPTRGDSVMGLVDELVGSEGTGRTKPLAINHTPMNSSHSHPEWPGWNSD